MEIPGISANDPALGAAFASPDLDKDAFMRLLVTQLENQDPLEPTKNEEFIAQLATFSSLEQLEELNGNIIAMIALNQSNALLSQLTQGSDLIGKTVVYSDPFTGQTSTGVVDSVKITDGFAILNLGGEDIPLAAVEEILEGSQETESTESTEEV